MLNQSTRLPAASHSLPDRHYFTLDPRDQSPTRVTERKTRALYFQSLTHSSQSTDRSIPSIFLTLRTLCQNTLGVGYLTAFQNFAFPITPIKSISFAKARCKPFRILLFQNTSLQLLWNLTLSQKGVGWGWDLLISISSSAVAGEPESPYLGYTEH